MKLTSHKLGDFCRMRYGKMPPKNIRSDDGFPIFSGYRVTGFAKEYLYEEPKIVVVARGVGGTGDVKISPRQSWVTNLSIILDDFDNIADKKFLFYRLTLEPLKEKLNTGAAQAQITIDSLSSYVVTLPELQEQKRIASILSAYDDLIENNRRRIQLLEESARLLYKEWFVHLRFPGHEHVKIIDGIPEGWEKKLLSEVAGANMENYKANSLPDELNYIDISSIERGRILAKKNLSAKTAPGRARRKAKSGDIVWSNVRPNLRAFALVINPDVNDVFSTGVTVLTPMAVPFSYLYLFVTTDDFVAYLVNRTTGASYPAVRPSDFESAMLLVPSEKILSLFHEKVAPIYQLINVLENKNKTLTQARDLLLPRLVNGELMI